MIIRFLSAVIALTLLAACGEKAPEDYVPLPRAYPRIAVYDSVYAPVDSLPLVWECNTSAKVNNLRTKSYVNIVYPAYSATLYLSFFNVTSEKDRLRVLANRQERMLFNAGASDSELTEFLTPPGFEVKMIVTPMGSPVPLQFLAVGSQWIVSGALHMRLAPESADSVAPVIRAVERDVVHALMQMR